MTDEEKDSNWLKWRRLLGIEILFYVLLIGLAFLIAFIFD